MIIQCPTRRGDVRSPPIPSARWRSFFLENRAVRASGDASGRWNWIKISRAHGDGSICRAVKLEARSEL